MNGNVVLLVVICAFILIACMVAGMPRFFSLMPRPRRGVFRSRVIRYTEFSERVVWRKDYRGLLRAYLAVRLAAWMEDFSSGCRPGWREVGIRWGINEVVSGGETKP